MGTRRPHAVLLEEVEQLWPYENPASLARRLNYSCLENMLHSLSHSPEGKVWARRLKQADALQRGNAARKQLFDKAS